MYEISRDKAFYWTLTVLQFLFCIPRTLEKPYTIKFLVFNKMINIMCLLIFTILPCYHLIASIRSNGLDVDISEDISITLTLTSTSLVGINFSYTYEKWSNFLFNIESLSKFGHHPNFYKLKNRLNLFSKGVTVYLASAVAGYAVFSYLNIPSCEKLNREKGLNEMCGTFTPLKLPFEVTNLYEKIAIFVVQMIFSFFAISPCGLVCYLIYESTELIISLIKDLKHDFKHIFDEIKPELRRNKLRSCIIYHIYILRLTKLLKRLVKITVGHLSLTCAVVFACIENQAVKSKPVGACLTLVGYSVSFFFVCHAGQRIMDEAMSIGNAAYDSKWYEGDTKIMKDIMFVIARCQKPVYLDALPLGSFNYPLFLMICKTSYTYFTLLQQST